MAGLSLDRPRPPRLLLGRRHGRFPGGGLLSEAELPLVRPHSLLRVGAVGAGPDPEFPLVRSGLHRRGSRRCGRIDQAGRGGSGVPVSREGSPAAGHHLDVAGHNTHPPAGTSVEVRGGGAVTNNNITHPIPRTY